MSQPKDTLAGNNDKIIKCIADLKKQRKELEFLIGKQQEEQSTLQTEMERITLRLGVISKGHARRVAAKDNYDIAIKNAEESYQEIVTLSGRLLQSIRKNMSELEEAMDKKIGTDTNVKPQSNSSLSENSGRELPHLIESSLLSL
ncbi:13 kDa deflagellation-inducible protein-like [Photinus pyralis]|uniref:13 kDa deflagellation-inducible protein-like n=1 Tax=Photinus pyralis TaxID=7054 RepID=UPI0012676BC0|nr:13 kDa deflagellation-inducible protein-like [Photinus pyralis]